MFNLAFATSDQHMSILRRLFTLFQDNAFVETCRNLPATRVAKYVEDARSILKLKGRISGTALSSLIRLLIQKFNGRIKVSN